jgi:hypothetical protein
MQSRSYRRPSTGRTDHPTTDLIGRQLSSMAPGKSCEARGQRGREIETSAMPLMAASAVAAFITVRTPVPLLRRAAGRPLVPMSVRHPAQE